MPRFLSRRVLIGVGLVAVTGASLGWSVFSRPGFAGSALSVRDAHKAAMAGEILLIDIRQPEEWAQTGIGEGAHPIDMRRQDFLEALKAVSAQAGNLPIALICASGVRSAWLANQLSIAGFSNVIDVPEGMMGSGAGPGWLNTRLPVRAYEG